MTRYLFFLSTPYYDIMSGIEKDLPLILSKNKQVICFDHPQINQTFRNIAKYKFLFERVNPNLMVFHSIGFFPMARSVKLFNILNYRINWFLFTFLSRILNINLNSVKILSFTPEITYLKFGQEYHNKTTYYVTDNFISLPQWRGKRNIKQFKTIEKNFLRSVKKIVVVSDYLYKKYRLIHNNVHLFPTPSYSKHFYKYSDVKSGKIRLNNKHPIVGFMGTFFHWKIDVRWLMRVMTRNPKLNFVFIGIIDVNNYHLKNLNRLHNFHFLGQVAFSDLPNYINQFDVCLIPYRNDYYGKYAYPVKVMEYLALHKPVITTALPSIKYLDDKKLIYWSKNLDQFKYNINMAIKEKCSQSLYRKRVVEALKNDWSERIEQLKRILDE